jgi:hypothetical protein
MSIAFELAKLSKSQLGRRSDPEVQLNKARRKKAHKINLKNIRANRVAHLQVRRSFSDTEASSGPCRRLKLGDMLGLLLIAEFGDDTLD